MYPKAQNMRPKTPKLMPRAPKMHPWAPEMDHSRGKIHPWAPKMKSRAPKMEPGAPKMKPGTSKLQRRWSKKVKVFVNSPRCAWVLLCSKNNGFHWLNPTQGEGAPPPFDISTDGLRVRACLNETDSPDLSVPLMIPLIIRGMFCLLGAISHSLLSCTYCLHTSNGSSTAMFFWWIPTYN